MRTSLRWRWTGLHGRVRPETAALPSRLALRWCLSLTLNFRRFPTFPCSKEWLILFSVCTKYMVYAGHLFVFSRFQNCSTWYGEGVHLTSPRHAWHTVSTELLINSIEYKGPHNPTVEAFSTSCVTPERTLRNLVWCLPVFPACITHMLWQRAMAEGKEWVLILGFSDTVGEIYEGHEDDRKGLCLTK
jgi:hypothetical protein